MATLPLENTRGGKDIYDGSGTTTCRCAPSPTLYLGQFEFIPTAYAGGGMEHPTRCMRYHHPCMLRELGSTPRMSFPFLLIRL